MSTQITILLKATDQASSILKKASGDVKSSLSDIEGANRKVKGANDQVEVSSKQVALAFNNVATSGFALYNAVDRVMDMQVQVDRANLAVKTSLNAVEDAQKRYTDAVEKHGASSEQALAAQKDLQLAQERYQVACERADMIQGNLNEAMVQSAMTVIPSLITMITSVSTLTTGWTAVTGGISGALSFLSANPIVLVIAAIAALVLGLIYLYNNCEDFRNLINTIGKYLMGGFRAAWDGLVYIFNTYVSPAIETIQGAFQWLFDNVLKPIAVYLIGTLLSAWRTLADGISYIYNSVLKPVWDALTAVYNYVLKPIGDFFSWIGGALGGILGLGGAGGGGPAGGIALGQGPKHGQKGAFITEPTLLLAGEAGPEVLTPLTGPYAPRGLGTTTIHIHGSLVNIEGSCDRKTAEYAVGLVEKKLKNVVVEASTSSAASTHKRIRFGV